MRYLVEEADAHHRRGLHARRDLEIGIVGRVEGRDVDVEHTEHILLHRAALRHRHAEHDSDLSRLVVLAEPAAFGGR